MKPAPAKDRSRPRLNGNLANMGTSSGYTAKDLDIQKINSDFLISPSLPAYEEWAPRASLLRLAEKHHHPCKRRGHNESCFHARQYSAVCSVSLSMNGLTKSSQTLAALNQCPSYSWPR